MHASRTTVLLPCHSLEDFPTWLDGDEARDLIDAWTAAWHPGLLAATGSVPGWASIDRPPDSAENRLFVAPAAFDERLSGTGLDAIGGVRLIRQVRGRAKIVQAALEAVGHGGPPEGVPFAEDFHALGLARLLSELLALRMRSSFGAEAEAFDAAAVAAAHAATAGNEAEARERIAECFETLAGIRRRYYPVDIWLVDLVLLADSTLGDPLAHELGGPGVRSIVATGDLVDRIAKTRPDMLPMLRQRIAAGDLAVACGLWDDSPIHAMTPEAILDSLTRARSACVAHTGEPPATFARRTGGFSAILPQLLGAVGYSSAVYHLFDGSALPDAGSGRVRWEAPSGSAIEALAASPLDARSPHTAVALAESIGDVLDHSHTAVVAFAHYPGTAAGWFHDFRRIHAWSDVFGRFATPDTVVRETAGAGVRADFEPDAFRDRLPRADAAGNPIGLAVASAAAEALAIRDSDARRASLVPLPAADASEPPSRKPAAAAAATNTSSGRHGGWLGRFFDARSRPKHDAAMLLENGRVAVRVHPETGGILSFRRASGGPNRLSQQLALRSTRPQEAGGRYEDPLDRATYSLMTADAIERFERPDGATGIESRGRLVADGHAKGTFTQRVWLSPTQPIATVELALDLASPIPSPAEGAGWFDHYAACRFAWNENDDVELFRSLHTQSVATERTTFFSDWFIELRTDVDPCAILTAGLPWHVRSSPHMLDTLLAGAGQSAARSRLAIGLGLPEPWSASLDLLAPLAGRTAGITASPAARITGGEGVVEGGSTVGLRIGVLESHGRTGLVRLSAPVPIIEAWRTDARGHRDRPLAIEDGFATIDLGRYEWAMIELRFGEGRLGEGGSR